MTAVRHSAYMTVRQLMSLWRQPWFVLVTLVQPVIWLLLFAPLFKSIADIPGFGDSSYLEYLTPGVLVMTAFFTAGWGGMSMVDDIERGFIDRFLASPVRRGSLIYGRLLQSAVVIVIQSLIIVGLALLAGASFPNGPGGVAILIGVAAVLGGGFGALSNGLGLLSRREETVIAVMQFFLLPLTFISGAFMQLSLAPGWIESLARFNPVNWAVEAGRSAAMESTDWGLVASRSALLLAFLVVASFLATRAFRVYQRSI
jgi:ABC-2 type transport system permease protein